MKLGSVFSQNSFLKLLKESKKRYAVQNIFVLFKYIHSPGYYLVFEMRCNPAEAPNINDVGLSLNSFLSRKVVPGSRIYRCDFKHTLRSGVSVDTRMHSVISFLDDHMHDFPELGFIQPLLNYPPLLEKTSREMLIVDENSEDDASHIGTRANGKLLP